MQEPLLIPEHGPLRMDDQSPTAGTGGSADGRGGYVGGESFSFRVDEETG